MSFSLTSRNIRLEGGATLVADCRTASGRYLESCLVLNSWLGINEYGDFDAFAPTPGFSQHICDLELDQTRLRVKTLYSLEGWANDTFNLDTYVRNQDGRLVSLSP